MSLDTLDAKIVVIYAVLTIILGFMLPALGMAGTAQTASDVPEFNVSQTRFDFVDDLPEFPLQPNEGVLNHSSTKFDNYRGSIQQELGEDQNGNRTFIVAIDNDTVHLTDVSTGGNGVFATRTFTSNDETATLSGQGFKVDVHSIDISNNSGKYEYVITERPGGSTILGSLFNTADAVANVIGYIFVSFVVISLMIVEGAANLGGLMFDTVTLFVAYGTWIVGFAGTVIGSAPGYAAAIIAVVYSPMYYVFAKMVMTVINMVNPFG